MPGLLAPSPGSTWRSPRRPSAEDALAGGTACRLLFGTTEVEARLRLLDRDALEPGASTQAQLHLAEAVAVPAREPFVLRLDSPAATVAGGRVLDPASWRRRRHDPRVMADLAALAAGAAGGGDRPPPRAGRRGRGAAARARPPCRHGAGAGSRRLLAESGAREIGDRFIGAPAFDALRTGALAALAQHHRDNPMEHGIALERLSRTLGPPGGCSSARSCARWRRPAPSPRPVASGGAPISIRPATRARPPAGWSRSSAGPA